MKEISLQLYSVGAYASQDMYSTLKRVADIGYTGVEFAGYFGVEAGKMKAWLDEFGLKAVSSHVNVFGDIKAELDYLSVLGAKNIVLPGTAFDDRESVIALAKQMNEIGKACNDRGIALAYHNHTHEFKKAEDGTWLLDVFYDNSDTELVGMQLDVCWALVGGADPVTYLAKYKDRIRSVHMKEVLTVSPYAGTAVGDGIVDFPGIYTLLGDAVPYIVEQEGISTMECWEGLSKSSDYLHTL